MREHESVMKIDEEALLDQDWRLQAKIADHYTRLTDKCIKMLSKLGSILDRHLRRIVVAKQRIKLSPANARLIHTTRFLQGSNIQKLQNRKIKKKVCSY